MTKRRSKNLVLGPGARRTFRLSSHTSQIPFSVLSRTKKKKFNLTNHVVYKTNYRGKYLITKILSKAFNVYQKF